MRRRPRNDRRIVGPSWGDSCCSVCGVEDAGAEAMTDKRYSDQEIEDAIENLESTDTYSSVINNAHRAGAAHIIRQLQADLKEAKAKTPEVIYRDYPCIRCGYREALP